VHPRPEVAARLGGEPKTELWYVTEAQPGAFVYLGVRRGVKRAQFERKLAEGTVIDCLHPVPVRAGDAVFVPSGRVHSIGAGIVVFEVQQNSDTTYRVHDWHRMGADGRPRELHVEQAMAAIDFDDLEPGPVQAAWTEHAGARARPLAGNDMFAIWERQMPGGFQEQLPSANRPLIVGLAAGALSLRHSGSGLSVNLVPGQFCLVPASVGEVTIATDQPTTCLLAEPTGKAEPVATPRTESSRQAVPPWEAYATQRSKAAPPAGRGAGTKWRRLKSQLVRRLTYSPFLRMLLLKFWFRTVMLAFFILALLVAIITPRIWTANPPDFLPIIKVSLLDRIQARMLRRSAERSAAAKHPEAAFEAWRSAFGYNQADPVLGRGLLASVLAQESPERTQMRIALQVVPWLLRLSHTNQSDLELAVRLYEKTQMHEQVHALLEPLADRLSPELELALTRAAFFENLPAEFNRLWAKLSPQQKEDPETALCQAASLAGGWGPREAVEGGRRILDATAAGSSPLRNLANQVVLVISGQQSDLAAFEQALRRLEENRADTGANHATHWHLLVALGRKGEAVRLATDYAYPPKTARDVVRLSSAYASLGLVDQALKFLKRYAAAYARSEEVWQIYGTVALLAKDWEELRSVALQMRRIVGLQERSRALSYYFEGRADHATGRRDSALLSFAQAAESDFPDPVQALAFAKNLLALGYPRPAQAMLTRLEPAFTTNLDYWDTVCAVAAPLKDAELLLRAASASYDLLRDSANRANRYAAALLLVGNRPEEAVRMTFELFSRFPELPAARINHCLGLLQNRRTDEAAEVLRGFAATAVNQLSGEELTYYYLAHFLLAVQQKEFAQARTALEKIDVTRLFPSEQQWVENSRQLLPQ
jgi:predicted Zn-dependent protease